VADSKGKRVPLMAGNWKMNLNHQEAVVLVQKLAWTLSDKKHDYAKVEVAVIPPFTDIRSVQTLVDGDRLKIKYGAQDVSQHDSGAYTGEISAGMLAKLGCSYVVVGHSERRQYHDESDELVNAKSKKAS
jgi:triosephosphate isomerase (TIM)